MGKTVDISLESVQQLLGQIQAYFEGLDLFSLIAWGAIGVGLILVIVSLIVW